MHIILTINIMTSEIIYRLNEADFQKVIKESLEDLQKTAILGRFADRLISADTVADIHNMHRDTVIRYAKAGLIEHQHTERLYKFQLSYVLALNFHDLKKQFHK